MSEETPTPKPPPTQQEVAAVAALVSSFVKMARHPGSAVAFVLLAGPIATYLMTEYVAPEIRKGIEAHAVDRHAHPEPFERLDLIETRIGELERRYDEDTTAMAEVLSEVSAALKEK
jgi:hypothetical protein